MASGLYDAVRALVQDKGISEDLVLKTIEDFLLAAYKKKFGTSDNAVVKFSDDGTEVTIFAQRKIVEDVYDPVSEMDLEEAKTYNEDAEIGDELLIEVNPKEFDRVAVQSAKQKARQTLREIQKDTLYSEYKDKVGEMIIGYYQRERNGNIFVDLGKTEGLLPRRYQSPREVYRPNDRIKAMIYEVSKAPQGLQIILSRTHTEFVKRVFELEVPEVYDKTVEIFKLVREPGYRTKIAVYSNRDDVDPVGACVGLRGVRIQAVVRELEGEKIDILKYDNDPREFIRNALSPAEVQNVVILDEGKRQAMAVVPESQLSLAIGKQGLNVRLANRLVDWNIDVKTQDQFVELGIAPDTRRAVSALFGDFEEEEEEITRIAELPDVPDHIVIALANSEIELIEDLVVLSDEDMDNIEGLNTDDVARLRAIITESVEIIEEEEEEEGVEEEYEDAEGEGEAEEFSEESVEETQSEETVDETAPAESDEDKDDDEEEVDEEVEEEVVDEAVGTDESEAEEVETPDETEDEEAEDEDEDEYEYEDEEEVTNVSELPGISETAVEALEGAGIVDIVDLIGLSDSELAAVPGLSDDDAERIKEIIAESVEIIEEEEDNPED